jgi:hypothetical protein
MGNMLGMPTNRPAWEAETKDRVEAWMDKYQKDLYNAPEFNAYLGFTSNEFVKLGASFAARSASRAGAAADKGFPPLVDVKNLRAIGYGGALNTSGSCGTLFFGASEFLGLDDKGNIPNEKKEALRKTYLYDYKAQDAINRATFGVVMADMNTAWTYVGAKRDAGADKTTITAKNGQSFDVRELAKSGEDALEVVKAAQAKIRADENSLSLADKEILAMHVLAKIDVEYQSVSKGLLQLHRMVKNRPIEAGDAMQPEAGKQLLAELPVALRTQIQESLHNINPEREFMAGLFQKIVDGKEKLPDRRNPELYPKIYHAMGAVFECFENVPRAYTRPDWAVACEKQQVSKAA